MIAKTLCMAAVIGVLLAGCVEENPAEPASSDRDAGAAAWDVGPLLDGGLPASDAEPMDRFQLPETGFDASAGDAASPNPPRRDASMGDTGTFDAGMGVVIDDFCQTWELPFAGRIVGNEADLVWLVGPGGVAQLVDGEWRRLPGTEGLSALSGWVAADGTFFFAAQPLDAGPQCRELFLYRYEDGQLSQDAIFDSRCPPAYAAYGWCDRDWACFTTEMVGRSKTEVYVGWAKDVLRWDGTRWSVLYVNGPDDGLPEIGHYEFGHGPCRFGNLTSSTASFLGLVGDRGVFAICNEIDIDINAYVFNGEKWVGVPSPPLSRVVGLGPPNDAHILADLPSGGLGIRTGWNWVDQEGQATYVELPEHYPSIPLGGARPDLYYGLVDPAEFWITGPAGTIRSFDLRSYLAFDEEVQNPFLQSNDTLWAIRVRSGLPDELIRCDLSKPPPSCDEGNPCPTGYFCASTHCSGPGKCVPALNGPCSRDFEPVCGCDSITYTNYCHARVASMRIEREGSCF